MNKKCPFGLIINILLFLIINLPILSHATSWDQVINSGEYYYGVGTGVTEEEADRMALASLASMIATNVSSTFDQIDDIKSHNGDVEHNSRVLSCIQTYSQSTLTNTERWVEGGAPDVTVRRYMKRSELERIFTNRIAKAQSMIDIADECLEHRKIDMALQYYYWAYSLLRSVQFPSEVKDGRGRCIIDWLPVKIEEILTDVNVQFVGKDGDFTDLRFTYRGQPVSSLEFSYSDGRAVCQGLAKDGRGMMEMLPGYETDTYHLDIEYEYKSQARGDSEMESVLRVITPKVFPKSAVKVKARPGASPTLPQKPSKAVAETADKAVSKPEHATLATISPQTQTIDRITRAITNQRYSDVAGCFTIDGLDMFNRLTSYGKARILDTSNIRYHKGQGGRTVARGLKMSFSFNGRRKKTFVEDVSLTFNPEGKIENVAFGLGDVAESGIYNHRGGWSEQVREIIVSFMENYKTAYSLERLDYLRSIFSDDAQIIVGNVVRTASTANRPKDLLPISLEGQQVIRYNHYTKQQYMAQLERCFYRNDFINLRFTSHEIQWLEKFNDQTIFAINIRQEYDSSTYADDGYLFLLVDMTNPDEPQIKVRTWQPNEVELSKLYNAGDFFNY